MIYEGGGFTVIGDDEEQTPQDLRDAAPATVVDLDQQLYEEVGDFGKGAHVGWAHGTLVKNHHNMAVCHVTFVFERNGDSVVAHGVLPLEGDTIADGRLAVTGGTGDYQHASGTMYVETVNPKRWKYDPGV